MPTICATGWITSVMQSKRLRSSLASREPAGAGRSGTHGGICCVTERIKVGSGVINNWTRNIGLLAATFLTLDDLAPNRIVCGIGAWWDPLARNVGIDRKKPLTAMRETVTCCAAC